MSNKNNHIDARIAVLEDRDREQDRDIINVYKEIRDYMDQSQTDRDVIMMQMNDLRQQVSDVNKEITHYKGIVGGVILAITFMGTAIGLAYKYFIN